MYIYNTISVPRESRGPHIDKLALPEKLSVSGSGRNSAARLSLAGPACLHQQRVYGDEEVTSALPRGIGGRGKMMAASRARRFALTTQEPVSRVVNASSSVFDGVRPPMELPGPPTLCARCKEKGNARRSERRCDCECTLAAVPHIIYGGRGRERGGGGARTDGHPVPKASWPGRMLRKGMGCGHADRWSPRACSCE